MINFIIKQYKISNKKNLTKYRYKMNTLVLMKDYLKLFTFLPAYLINLKISPDKINIYCNHSCSYIIFIKS